MANVADVPVTETVRMIAVARILMPKSVVRLSAGRARCRPAIRHLLPGRGQLDILQRRPKDAHAGGAFARTTTQIANYSICSG